MPRKHPCRWFMRYWVLPGFVRTTIRALSGMFFGVHLYSNVAYFWAVWQLCSSEHQWLWKRVNSNFPSKRAFRAFSVSTSVVSLSPALERILQIFLALDSLQQHLIAVNNSKEKVLKGLVNAVANGVLEIGAGKFHCKLVNQCPRDIQDTWRRKNSYTKEDFRKLTLPKSWANRV